MWGYNITMSGYFLIRCAVQTIDPGVGIQAIRAARRLKRHQTLT